MLSLNQFQTGRRAILALSIIINLAAVGLTAHYLFVTLSYGVGGSSVYGFEIHGLLVGTLAMIVLPILLMGRSTVKANLQFMGVFSILWITECALVHKSLIDYYNYEKTRYEARLNKDILSIFPFRLDCSSMSGGYCYELNGIESLTITLLVLSLLHFFGLLIYVRSQQSQGCLIWNTPISQISEDEEPPSYDTVVPATALNNSGSKV
ncbi:hypothetical protein BJ165DRAFT_1458827 [Panaeolus papilionaceus]|nr:hypothetical protein BJ165DRAFT_1458827 [Panaeolus papilionaceus]